MSEGIISIKRETADADLVSGEHSFEKSVAGRKQSQPIKLERGFFYEFVSIDIQIEEIQSEKYSNLSSVDKSKWL